MYKKIGPFTKDDFPKGLLKKHRTASSVWGEIVIEEGSLEYVIDSLPREVHTLSPNIRGIIEPQVYHHLEFTEDVVFFVEFFK